jgi:polyhydroxyalkanoate synthase
LPRVLNPLDISIQSTVARHTFSISPTSLVLATFDWAIQLSLSPGKRLELITLGINQSIRLSCYSRSTFLDKEGRSETECVIPPSFDKRFQPEQWHRWPFNVLHQSFLLTDEWWNAATTNVMGVSRHHEHIVSFMARQWLDTVSPGNFLLTNPVAIQKTTETGGRNLVRGAINFIDDSDPLTLNDFLSAGTLPQRLEKLLCVIGSLN